MLTNNYPEPPMTQNNDKMLEMFFDEDFVPQAYVDIILSSFDLSKLEELKFSCSSLLSRMDFYTNHLTNELESTIHKLQKPAELVLYASDESQQGMTKLEYYLDTLADSVKSLESDVKNLNDKLAEFDLKHESSNTTTETIRDLTLAKSRLMSVKKSLELLKSVADIAIKDEPEKLQKIDVNDFKVALNALQETTIVSLHNLLPASGSGPEPNNELIKRIDALVELKNCLKGLDRFYTPYLDFVQAIQKEKNAYLNSLESVEDL